MQPKRKRRLNYWVLSFFNGIFMLCFSLYWLSLPYNFGDERFLIKWSSLIKKSLLGLDDKPNPEEVLFVNVAKNKTTINTINEFGEPSSYDRKVITDRQLLIEFFSILNRYKSQLKFVLCDVLFEDETPHDRALEQEFTKLDEKALAVSAFAEEHLHIRPAITIPYAPASYTTTDGVFLKFPLVLQDSLKTIPLVMFERLNAARFQKKGWLYWLNGRLSLPRPIVDFKVRNADFRIGTSAQESNFALYEMGTLLEMRNVLSAEEFRHFFEGKIILIGDFKEDVHNTPFGRTPGSLILYNAYLTLVAKQNIISWSWVIFMLCSFSIISYRIFADIKIEKPNWLVKSIRSKIGQFSLNALDELALLTLMTLLSYFIFNIHVNILILLIYLKIIDFVWNRLLLRKLKPTISEKVVVTTP